MFFLQMSRSPVFVTIGKNIRLKMQKFTIDDVVEWSQHILDKQVAEATKDMDEVKRREYITFYRPVAPDLAQMKLWLKTPEGALHVVRTCLRRAEVSDANGEKKPALSKTNIDTLLGVNGAGRLHGLATALADLDEQSVIQPPEEVGGDPLTSGERAASEPLPVTGPTISQPSTQLSPA